MLEDLRMAPYQILRYTAACPHEEIYSRLSGSVPIGAGSAVADVAIYILR